MGQNILRLGHQTPKGNPQPSGRGRMSKKEYWVTEYTIVEPGFEFIDPPTSDNYLEFLERCTRVCYASEGLIKPGSAEKLMNKVVKEYEHYSVTEHANLILRVNTDIHGDLPYKILQLNQLMRISHVSNFIFVSGNVRMWMEFFKAAHTQPHIVWSQMETALHEKMPFFFNQRMMKLGSLVCLVDENPLTNTHQLTSKQMSKHMTLTCRVVCNRATSHQLVRHRKFAFSQQSQRYCNFGKKGFQFIIPDSHKKSETTKKRFTDNALHCYETYLEDLRDGIIPEDARDNLPNCTKTEVVTTGTLEYWKHVFEHRGHNPKAQAQIRNIMFNIEKKFHELVPQVF